MFEVIDMERLERQKATLKEAFQGMVPFRYMVFERLLFEEKAWEIFREFPPIDPAGWVDSNGLHQKNKWTNPVVEGSVAERFFQEVNSPPFLRFISEVTKIPEVIPDKGFFGAGYHQTKDGGFLNVHVDFNKLIDTDLDRRLNLLLYLNPEWPEHYGGALELWDMEANRLLERVLPCFNRCVLFETNDISYHGHPTPVRTGGKTTRKSLSVYYYSRGRDDGAATAEHNTLYVNTEGFLGALKLAANAVRESCRRVAKRIRG